MFVRETTRQTLTNTHSHIHTHAHTERNMHTSTHIHTHMERRTDRVTESLIDYSTSISYVSLLAFVPIPPSLHPSFLLSFLPSLLLSLSPSLLLSLLTTLPSSSFPPSFPLSLTLSLILSLSECIYMFTYIPYSSSSLSLLPYLSSIHFLQGYPDISLLGVKYIVSINGSFFPLDGTSASCPVAASMVSLVNSARLASGRSTIG